MASAKESSTKVLDIAGAPLESEIETLDLTDGVVTDIELLRPALERNLRSSLGKDGCLDDLIECKLSSLPQPAAIAPWKEFKYRLYSSKAATVAIRALLQCTVPGTDVSYADVFSAIKGADKTTPAYCFLVGGQVRDVLRGALSSDVDFNYACDARVAALACVAQGWPTKYKKIGPGSKTPNYVLVGDEASSCYVEGFATTFNATTACYNMDFRQNMLFYDLSNDVIIDKTGHGVDDIRGRALRLSCAGAAAETFEQWAAATITPGFKELRYIKFLLRAQSKGEPMAIDDAECAFVVTSLKAAMRSNAAALKGFWFGYALEAQLKSAEGRAALRRWVVEHGGAHWWASNWAPLVRACAPAAGKAATTGRGCKLLHWPWRRRSSKVAAAHAL